MNISVNLVFTGEIKCTLTDEVTGAAKHLWAVDSSRVGVRHIQLPCYWVGGQVVAVSWVVAMEGGNRR